MLSTGLPGRFSLLSGSSGNSSATPTPNQQHAVLGHSPAPILCGSPMESSGFNGFPGDGTIHISCLAGAPHELLMRSQNAAYIAAMQKIEGLSRHIQFLEGELGGQKKAFEDMVNKLPILLGLTGEGNQAANTLQEGCNHSSTCKVVLGLGMIYPATPDAPPDGVHLKFWSKKTFNGRIIRQGKKTGQHNSDKNIGQAWIEDERGNIIPGYVAHSIREILTSCFHSLAWSGQAPLLSRELGHEARVYIHNVLGGQFPFLLICEGGRWKINELITQGYSGFVGTHLRKKTFGKQETKTSKRARSENTTSDSESEEPHAKAPKHASDLQSSHETPLSTPLLPTVSSNSPSHPLLEPDATLFAFGDQEEVVSAPPATSLGIAPPILPAVPQSTPSTHGPVAEDASPRTDYEHHQLGAESTVHESAPGDQSCHPEELAMPVSLQGQENNLPSVLHSEVLAPNVSGSSLLTTGVTTRVGVRPQIPTPKPFAVITRSPALAMQPAQPGIQAAAGQEPPQTTTTLPSGDILLPPPQTAATSPPIDSLPPPSQTAATPPPTDALPVPHQPAATSAPVDALPPHTEVQGTAINGDAPSQQGPGRRRGPPSQVKAVDKYNPNTVSVKSFHMRDLIKENPDILHTDCQRLFGALQPAQRKMYQDEVTRANRERKGKERAG